MLTEDIDRSTYLGFLEKDYHKRMIEEYGDEVGLFGRVGPLIGIEDKDKTATPKLEEYLDNRLNDILGDTKTL